MESGVRSTYRVGDLLVDLGSGLVTRGGTEIPLPKLSFNLLRALIEAAPNLVTPDELMRLVWPGLVVAPETVSQRVKLLRQALGDNAREPRYLVGVRGRGYRLVAPVEIVVLQQASQRSRDPGTHVADAAAPALASLRSGPTPIHPWPRRPGRRNRWLAAVALCAAASAVLALRTQTGPAREADPAPSDVAAGTVARPVLAVLPFVKLGGPDDPLSLPDGLQSDILTEMSRTPALGVIAATSVEQFRGTTLDAREIGRRLGATHLLEAGVQRVGDRVRVNVQLIDARTQGHVWAATYDRPLTAESLFSVQSEIAEAVAGALRIAFSGDGGGSRRAMPTVNIDAWALERAARVQLERRTTESIANAERLFRQAVALDPLFARAYSGLADTVWLKADYEGRPWLPAASEAERLASIALRLDPDLAEAWTTRAKLAQERHDVGTAELAYKRAFELNPNYARAHAWYSQFMYQLGREQEASAATRRAAELDPMSAPLLVNLGLDLVDPDDPAAALTLMDRAIEADPTGWIGAYGKAQVLARSGRYDEALHWSLRALRLDARAGYPLVGAARWHLELDDLEGARTWIAQVSRSGLENPASLGNAALFSLYNGDSEAAVASARRAQAYDPHEPIALRVLVADALRRGDAAAVIANVRSHWPELAGPGPVQIQIASLMPATDLALALRLSGESLGSEALLEAVAVLLETARRGGSVELAIDEIRVAAIRGDAQAALDELQRLVAGGWRGPYWRYYRDHDPAFDRLRADPRFRKAFARIEQDIVSQRVRAAHSGDLAAGPELAMVGLVR